jgi:hypothetical protein
LHVVKLKLTDKLHATIEEVRELRSVATIETFFLQLVDNELTQFRRLKIQRKFLTPSGPAEAITVVRKPKRFHELSPAVVQKILHLHETERLNASTLGQRFGCSAPTIARYIQKYESSAHVQRPVAPSCRANHDADEIGNFPRVKSRRKREVQDA